MILVWLMSLICWYNGNQRKEAVTNVLQIQIQALFLSVCDTLVYWLLMEGGSDKCITNKNIDTFCICANTILFVCDMLG